MKEVTKVVLQDAAKRLLFDMKDEEYDTLLNEFAIITKQLKLMDEIDGLDKVEPMSFPYIDDSFSLLREDVPVKEDEVNKEEMLENAKVSRDGQVKLPKVVN